MGKTKSHVLFLASVVPWARTNDRARRVRPSGTSLKRLRFTRATLPSSPKDSALGPLCASRGIAPGRAEAAALFRMPEYPRLPSLLENNCRKDRQGRLLQARRLRHQRRVRRLSARRQRNVSARGVEPARAGAVRGSTHRRATVGLIVGPLPCRQRRCRADFGARPRWPCGDCRERMRALPPYSGTKDEHSCVCGRAEPSRRADVRGEEFLTASLTQSSSLSTTISCTPSAGCRRMRRAACATARWSGRATTAHRIRPSEIRPSEQDHARLPLAPPGQRRRVGSAHRSRAAAPEAECGIAQLLLPRHFVPSLHSELYVAVGLGLEPAQTARLMTASRQRDRRMREWVLTAYEYRCAFCGHDGFGAVPVGLEAAPYAARTLVGHRRPDDIENGLCSAPSPARVLLRPLTAAGTPVRSSTAATPCHGRLTPSRPRRHRCAGESTVLGVAPGSHASVRRDTGLVRSVVHQQG